MVYGKSNKEAKIEHTPMEPKTAGRESGQYPALRRDVRGVGIVAGTCLLTLDGELPVDHLMPGDRLITRDTGAVALRGVEVHRVRTEAILFTGGSLGHTRPGRDLVVPPDQAVFVRDWRARAFTGHAGAPVPARRLLDGEFIRKLPIAEMTLYRMIMDAPHIVYADGLELACPGRAPAMARAA